MFFTYRVDKVEELVHGKRPGLNNPETFVLTHNRFNTYLVSIFTDLNRAQIFKMPYRDSPHQEIEIPMSVKYMTSFKPNEHTEDYFNRGPNDKIFLLELEDRMYD